MENKPIPSPEQVEIPELNQAHGFVFGGCPACGKQNCVARSCTHPPAPKLVTADDVPGKVVIDLWRIGVLTSMGTHGKDIIAKIVNAYYGLTLEA